MGLEEGSGGQSLASLMLQHHDRTGEKGSSPRKRGDRRPALLAQRRECKSVLFGARASVSCTAFPTEGFSIASLQFDDTAASLCSPCLCSLCPRAGCPAPAEVPWMRTGWQQGFKFGTRTTRAGQEQE